MPLLISICLFSATCSCHSICASLVYEVLFCLFCFFLGGHGEEWGGVACFVLGFLWGESLGGFLSHNDKYIAKSAACS